MLFPEGDLLFLLFLGVLGARRWAYAPNWNRSNFKNNKPSAWFSDCLGREMIVSEEIVLKAALNSVRFAWFLGTNKTNKQGRGTGIKFSITTLHQTKKIILHIIRILKIFTEWEAYHIHCLLQQQNCKFRLWSLRKLCFASLTVRLWSLLLPCRGTCGYLSGS